MEPDIPQQRQEQQTLADIRGNLDSQHVAVLSTHAEGQPYARLAALSATKDLRRIVFCTPQSTRKYADVSCDGYPSPPLPSAAPSASGPSTDG